MNQQIENKANELALAVLPESFKEGFKSMNLFEKLITLTTLANEVGETEVRDFGLKALDYICN